MTDVIEVVDRAPWLELLPEDVGTPEYRADVRREAQGRARHAELAAMIAKLDGELTTGLADPAVDPRTLTWAAVDVAATRAMASALPLVPVVDALRHDEVRRALPRPYRGLYLLPYPPAYAAELVHHQRGHAPNGEIPPVPGPLDVEAIAAYETVSASASRLWASLAFLDDGFTTDMPSYVRAWHDAVNADAWSALHTAINDLVALVGRANAARPPTPSCAYGAHSSFRLQAAVQGMPWNFAAAVRDGVLVIIN